MFTALACIALVVLFYLLGKAADVVVVNLRKLGKELGIKLYFLGFILGLFTSMPELAIGLDAAMHGVSALSLGNLMGGTVVVLGFVLGVSVILNRRVAMPSQRPPLGLIIVLLAMPLVLGIDGLLSRAEGMVLVLLYGALLYVIYRIGGSHESAGSAPTGSGQSLKHLFFIFAGLVALVALSDGILRVTDVILTSWEVSFFFVGLVVYSIGTNLPEIMVSLRAWRNHTRELSLSNLLGSAMANVFIIGLVVFLAPTVITIDSTYMTLIIGSGALFVALLVFARTGRRIVRGEGVVLVVMYAVFVITQLWAEFR